MDSIEYEIVDLEEREVWHCAGACRRYRHRPVLPGQLPAVCCGVPATFIDSYAQPRPVMVAEPIVKRASLRSS
jgi:predicted metal-binding protein